MAGISSRQQPRVVSSAKRGPRSDEGFTSARSPGTVWIAPTHWFRLGCALRVGPLAVSRWLDSDGAAFRCDTARVERNARGGGARRRRLEHCLWRVLRVGDGRAGVHGRSFDAERIAMGGSLGTDGRPGRARKATTSISASRQISLAWRIHAWIPNRRRRMSGSWTWREEHRRESPPNV